MTTYECAVRLSERARKSWTQQQHRNRQRLAEYVARRQGVKAPLLQLIKP